MSTPKRTIERWNGIEITWEGRRIVHARFKYGPKVAQQRETIDPQHYGSKQDLLDEKNDFLKLRRYQPQVTFKGTFADLWPTVLNDRSITERSRGSYRRDLESDYLKPLGSHTFRRMNRNLIEAVVKEMVKAGLARQTIETYLTPVSKVFTYGINKGYYLGANPVSQVWADLDELVGPKTVTKIRPYTDADMNRILAGSKERSRCLYALAYYSGGRIGELLGLELKHFTRSGDTIKVLFEGQIGPSGEWIPYLKSKKKGEYRRVELPAMYLPFHEAQERRTRQLARVDLLQPDARFFHDLTQRKVRDELTGYITKGHWVRGLREKLGSRFDGSDGWKPLTPHSFRHTFASMQYYRYGQSVEDIARWMGDTPKTVQSTYLHEPEEAYTINRPSPASGYAETLWAETQ